MDAAMSTSLLVGSSFEAGQEAREHFRNTRTGGLLFEVPEAPPPRKLTAP